MTPVQATHEMKIPGDVLPKIYRYSNKETQNSILQALNTDLYYDQFKSLRDSKIIKRIQDMDPKWLESTRVKLGVQRVLDVIKHGLGILERDGVQLTNEQRDCAFSAATRKLGDHEIMGCINPKLTLLDLFYLRGCIPAAMLAAAKNANLASIKYWQPFYEIGTLDDAILEAAKQGHKDVILCFGPFSKFGSPLLRELLIWAADYGWEEMVEDIVENMAKKLEAELFDVNVLMGFAVCEGAFEAAQNGHIKIADNLLRLPFAKFGFEYYFHKVIHQKLFPVVEVFAKHSHYILPIVRGIYVVNLCTEKQHDLLRLLFKSGPIELADWQAAISIASYQNDQESLAILNEK